MSNGTIKMIHQEICVRMLPKVTRTYFRQRVELTDTMFDRLREGYKVYPTLLVCECNEQLNIRSCGAVVVSNEGMVVEYLIRCKSCKNRIDRKEACDGEIS